MSRFNVALIGTSTLFRQGLRHLLDRNQFSVVSEWRDLSEFGLSLEEAASPDLVVVDLTLVRERDIGDMERLRSQHKDMKVVVLANEVRRPDMDRLLQAGADGYLSDDISAAAIPLCLLLVMEGHKVIPSGQETPIRLGRPDTVDNRLPETNRKLSERESEILRCLLEGCSNKHIGRILNISEGTVKVHMKSLMKKIAAGNRTQAALWAYNNGFDARPVGSRPFDDATHPRAAYS